MKTVNVCFITDIGYAVPTAVAVQSLIENRGKSTKYNIYIVAVNLDNDKIATFTNLANRDCRIRVITTRNMYDNIDTNHLYVSKAALLKFDLPNMFPELNKILYLDSDILVLGDLLELYNTDLSDKYAAVVPDMAGMLYGNHHTKFGFDKYFNSGVMLLNLKKMRNDKISEKLIDYKLHKDVGDFMDQDCLNYVFQQNVIYISPMYNWMAGNISGFTNDEIQKFYDITETDLDNIRQNPVVLHLTNKHKPWNSNNAVGYYLWWQYHKNMLHKKHSPISRLARFFFRHKVYPNGRHKILLCGIKVFSYKPRFLPDATVKGNFWFATETLPNGRKHIYVCGIKIASYKENR